MGVTLFASKLYDYLGFIDAAPNIRSKQQFVEDNIWWEREKFNIIIQCFSTKYIKCALKGIYLLKFML